MQALQTSKCTCALMYSRFFIQKSARPFTSVSWPRIQSRKVNCPEGIQDSKVERNRRNGIKPPQQLNQQCMVFNNYGTKTPTTKPNVSDPDGFKLVYTINNLKLIRMISLSKVYQTIFVVGIFPLSLYHWSIGSVSTAALFAGTSIVSLSLAMLYVIAYYFTSIVCHLYVNPKTEKVKISHLTFRTRRNDIIIDMQDIEPIFDVNPNREDLYFDVKTYDNKHKMKLFLRFGTVHDMKLLAEMLGKIL